jgi:hypothetical protein
MQLAAKMPRQRLLSLPRSPLTVVPISMVTKKPTAQGAD